MDRAIIYMFSDSSWMYACEFNPKFHSEKGKYHEIIVGRGWSSREVDEMIKPYYEENASTIFDQ